MDLHSYINELEKIIRNRYEKKEFITEEDRQQTCKIVDIIKYVDLLHSTIQNNVGKPIPKNIYDFLVKSSELVHQNKTEIRKRSIWF